MNFLSSLSAKNDLLSLLCRVRVEAHFPLESPFVISFRSLLRLLAVLSDTLTVENKDVSSANNLGMHWRLSDKSLMYTRNKSWPNIDPGGTPALILAQDELWLLRITLCFQFLKKSVKEIPLRLSLWIIPSCHTLSKAFEMSRNTPLTSQLSSKLENISWVMPNNWLTHESPGLNPDWFSDIKLFSIK